MNPLQKRKMLSLMFHQAYPSNKFMVKYVSTDFDGIGFETDIFWVDVIYTDRHLTLQMPYDPKTTTYTSYISLILNAVDGMLPYLIMI